jgi:hypothetical protein
LSKKVTGELVGNGTDTRLHVEDCSAPKCFLDDAAEPRVIWFVRAEHALGECPKYAGHPPAHPCHGAIILAQGEYSIVFQHAGGHLLRGGHPNPTHNWQPDLDYRSSRPQPFNCGRRIAKKFLASEIYV